MADPDGFDELYRTCRDRLVMQVAAVCGDPGEAADAVQEAFVRAWLRWDRVATYDRPEAWVRRVAFNLVVGRWRRLRRITLHADVPTPVVELDDEQYSLIEALAKLGVDQRRAVVLHHLVGLPVAEVADELGVPVGTVKSWLSRGRGRLATLLAIDDSLDEGMTEAAP